MPSSTPCAMPREGSSGVEETFQTSTRPSSSSNRQMSVKVPPESTPTRQRDMLDVLVSIDYSRLSKVRRSFRRLQQKFRKTMLFLFEIPVSETIVVKLPHEGS